MGCLEKSVGSLRGHQRGHFEPLGLGFYKAAARGEQQQTQGDPVLAN